MRGGIDRRPKLKIHMKSIRTILTAAFAVTLVAFAAVAATEPLLSPKDKANQRPKAQVVSSESTEAHKSHAHGASEGAAASGHMDNCPMMKPASGAAHCDAPAKAPKAGKSCCG